MSSKAIEKAKDKAAALKRQEKQEVDETIRKDVTTKVVEDSSVQRIIIPATMDKLAAAMELIHMHEDEETEQDFTRKYEGWFWKDTLVAIKRVSEETFGWMQGRVVWSFFGKKMPTEIKIVTDIRNGRKKTESCFYGDFGISSWEYANARVSMSDDGEAHITITGKKKFAKQISKYLDTIEEYLQENSIYRGKGVRVVADEDGHVEFEIMEVTSNPRIFLNEEEERVVQKFVLSSLLEEGKRCYLFTGKYGTGKTESAMRVGSEAIEKGVSFFYVKDSSIFTKMLHNATQYQPCIVFMEDLDEIGSGEERSTAMNRILNTLDGVDTKNNNLTVIFTTNHPERINQALRRPGRIDLVLKFDNPNTAAIAKIYKSYLNEFPGTVDYKKAAKETPDVSGAVIAEIAKRAVKLADKDGNVDTDTILAAISSMKYQIDLMEGKADTPVDPYRIAREQAVSDAVEVIMPEVTKTVDKVLKNHGI